MARKSQLERAIDKIDEDIAAAEAAHKQQIDVLHAARGRLVWQLAEQRAKKDSAS